jgi:hypothetical protein
VINSRLEADSPSAVLAKIGRLPTFSTDTYEYSELESMLNQFGRVWNFDVWFLYDTAKKDIQLVAEALYAQYGFEAQIGGMKN